MQRRKAHLEQFAGNPEATMADARETLRVAMAEARGQGRTLRARQSAEKVWLAASTAADAMVGPQTRAAGVFAAFERAWGSRGRAVVEDIEVALHRGCFYGAASACTGDYVQGKAKALETLLRKPPRDRQIQRRLWRREPSGE